ncbi:MAG: ABC transporter ATP-binding protein [Promethearchaeota archaeon]
MAELKIISSKTTKEKSKQKRVKKIKLLEHSVFEEEELNYKGKWWRIFDINKPRHMPNKNKKYKTSFRQILAYLLVPFRGMFFTTLILSILQSVLFLALPVLAGDILNQIVENRDFSAIIDNFLILFIALAGMSGVAYFRLYMNQFIGNSIIKILRGEIFLAIQASSYSFLDHHSTGDLMARCTSDLNTLKMLLSSQITFFIRQCLTVALAIIAMFTINFYITLMVMPIFPVIFITIYIFKRRIGPIYREARDIYGDEVTATIEENIGGVRVVRAFASEDFEIEKFNKYNDKYLAKQKEYIKLQVSFEPVVRLLVNLGMAIVIFFGGNLLGMGIIHLGDLFSYLLLLNFAIEPLFFINTFLGNISMYSQATDRICEVLNNDNIIRDPPPEKAKKFPNPVKGIVKFDHVWFSYRNNDFYELKDITFETKPGEVIAILGGTGSGKTTLVRLIGRFYEYSKGAITIDGINIRDVLKKDLRQLIGYVPQESLLFSTTIKENLLLGRPEGASMEEIIEACKLANIHDFIEGLPKKYETVVGQRGITLSGGQRQRIAIARALLKKPKILILDSATSSVDVHVEYRIQQGFKKMMANSTTFIITQRLSSVRHANRIIVLDKGKIVQIGSHKELMKDKDGVYYKLYTTLDVERRAIESEKYKAENSLNK